MDPSLELIAAPVFQLHAAAHGYTHISAGDPALRMALVERENGPATLKRDGLGWDRPGVYVLLGPGEGDFDATVYVGKAGGQGVARRIAQQYRDKDWWTRALVISSAHEDGWSSSDVGFLEGELHALVTRKHLSVTNDQTPKDDTLPAVRIWELRRFLPAVDAVLRVLGVGTTSLELEVLDESDELSSSVNDSTSATTHPERRPSSSMTWVDAAVTVLSRNPTVSMTARELVDAIFSDGLRQRGTARTPEATLRRDLAHNTRRGDAQVEQTAPATFRLKP